MAKIAQKAQNQCVNKYRMNKFDMWMQKNLRFYKIDPSPAPGKKKCRHLNPLWLIKGILLVCPDYL